MFATKVVGVKDREIVIYELCIHGGIDGQGYLKIEIFQCNF